MRVRVGMRVRVWVGVVCVLVVMHGMRVAREVAVARVGMERGVGIDVVVMRVVLVVVWLARCVCWRGRVAGWMVPMPRLWCVVLARRVSWL